MKLRNIVAGSFLLAASANATVTLGFSAGATNVANGFGNAAGQTNSARVWGIIVDANGDGFDGLAGATSTQVDGGNLYTSGALYDASGFVLRGTSGTGAISGGQPLSVNSSVTDDILFLSGNLSVVVSGESRISSVSAFSYSGGMAAGTKYAIIWFDTIAALDGSTVPGGTKYGLWTDTIGSSVVDSTILPADGASLTTAANGPAGMFAGVETNKAATLTLVGIPEPSSMLLGALGALGLLRRRRN